MHLVLSGEGICLNRIRRGFQVNQRDLTATADRFLNRVSVHPSGRKLFLYKEHRKKSYG